MTTYEGQLQGEGTRVAVVCSRFNEAITDRLLAGAIDGLRAYGVEDESITIAWVPGAFELPLAAARLAASGEYDAVVCLGAVIRGATGHYEQVAGQCAAGIQRAQMDTGVPVIFGVLTTDTVEQALERAGIKAGESTAGDYERREHLAPAGDRSSEPAVTTTGDVRTGLPGIQPAHAPADSRQAGSVTNAPRTEQPGIQPEQVAADVTALAVGAGTDLNVRPEDAMGSPPMSNKGYEAALAALEMCDLLRQLPKSSRA